MEDRGKHCECKGCRDYSTSNQPVAVAMSKVLHSHHSKEKKSNQLKSYSRKIQESWYKKYPWITVCSFQYRIFCRLCCYAKQLELLPNSDHTKSSFINNGFANWKKALQRFFASSTVPNKMVCETCLNIKHTKGLRSSTKYVGRSSGRAQ